MSYQVLARKWRPRNFNDMVGQEPILRMLGNALEQQRIHHAYLFTGTRGVGKTTIARIIARCLNCETGITANPCGTCSTCQAIDAGKFLDLYEVDAASRTKVEDTRELLENVLYPPTTGRYKIYLIDEVHMLSTHSFNALLKTLEEPPEHVKFLLATTDPKKLPVTILSRCLQFHLKRITPEQITKHLEHICQSEKINCELPALTRLARAADGSMRDALSLLDQAIAYGHGAVLAQEVNAMLGSLAQDELLPLMEAIAAQDGKQLLSAMNALSERAPDFQQVLEELISLLHQIAFAQLLPDAYSADESIQALAKRLNPDEIQLYYQIALLSRRDLSLAPSPQQGFEMSMLRMLALKPSLQTSTQTVAAPAAATVQARAKTVAEKPTAKSNAANTEQPAVQNSTEWREILPKLNLSGMAYALASNCTLNQITDTKVILTVAVSHEPMLSGKLKERIAESLSLHFKRPLQLEINVTAAEIVTPHKEKQREQDAQLSQAKQSILEDPNVKKLIDLYDATVDVSLITT